MSWGLWELPQERVTPVLAAGKEGKTGEGAGGAPGDRLGVGHQSPGQTGQGADAGRRGAGTEGKARAETGAETQAQGANGGGLTPWAR